MNHYYVRIQLMNGYHKQVAIHEFPTTSSLEEAEELLAELKDTGEAWLDD